VEDGGSARQLAALLTGVALLIAGNGPLTTLISLRLEALGPAPSAIGAIMAAYFAGLTLGSLLAYRIVLRAGHIRAFATFASATSAAALTYPLVAHPLPWAALRLAEGFCRPASSSVWRAGSTIKPDRQRAAKSSPST
jgi:MFS family permease